MGTEYQTVAPTQTSQGVCVQVTPCSSTQYVSTPHTLSSDRECSAVSECKSDEFEKIAPTLSADRVCRKIMQCDWDVQYQSQAHTPTSDSVCTVIYACTQQEYEILAPTAGRDRQCTPLTQCDFYRTEYEKTASTITSDRECVPLSPPCGAGEWESEPPGYNTDRNCIAGAPPTSAPTDPAHCTLDGYRTALANAKCTQTESKCTTEMREAAAGPDRMDALCNVAGHCAAFRGCIFGALASAHCTTTTVPGLSSSSFDGLNTMQAFCRTRQPPTEQCVLSAKNALCPHKNNN